MKHSSKRKMIKKNRKSRKNKYYGGNKAHELHGKNGALFYARTTSNPNCPRCSRNIWKKYCDEELWTCGPCKFNTDMTKAEMIANCK